MLPAMRFTAPLLVALALAPGLAHLMELPNKIGLARDDYLTVQQIYRGWALLGFVVVGALLSTIALAILVRGHASEFAMTVVALICIVGTQLVFWFFTFPVNQQTVNWTVAPDNWMALRKQWEYSHAASCGLNFIALVSLIGATVVRER